MHGRRRAVHPRSHTLDSRLDSSKLDSVLRRAWQSYIACACPPAAPTGTVPVLVRYGSCMICAACAHERRAAESAGDRASEGASSAIKQAARTHAAQQSTAAHSTAYAKHNFASLHPCATSRKSHESRHSMLPRRSQPCVTQYNHESERLLEQRET
ncbi:hypothetical protein IE81DRAFT_72025 [Ceraceosorus guamensis]|uniref:Uncharacterized protein n=1 Tax=Ceraceosorus guamensis TaxID=1522189 RepID=A0A316W0Z1_9BASI|nr:hypothetical protein IE81DRAFT_72025 [Ceraceosorus guamensis]PWN43597.1 hypothetical protein IE81DRAFT_72025 [Ceraceosorus guamensis]